LLKATETLEKFDESRMSYPPLGVRSIRRKVERGAPA